MTRIRVQGSYKSMIHRRAKRTNTKLKILIVRLGLDNYFVASRPGGAREDENVVLNASDSTTQELGTTRSSERGRVGQSDGLLAIGEVLRQWHHCVGTVSHTGNDSEQCQCT